MAHLEMVTPVRLDQIRHAPSPANSSHSSRAPLPSGTGLKFHIPNRPCPKVCMPNLVRNFRLQARAAAVAAPGPLVVGRGSAEGIPSLGEQTAPLVRKRPSAAAERKESEAEAAAVLRTGVVSTYSAATLKQLYSKQPFRVLGRLLNISTSLSSVAVAVLIDRQRGRGRLESNMGKRAKQLRGALTRLGPTFVKLGQALSTRPDLLPPVYLEELSLLQDALPTFPDKEAFELIERQLGRPLESIFASITARPIAAASLGQVYKAVLLGSSKEVAVKVQRPGIESAIGVDFYLLRILTSFVDDHVAILTTNVTALLDDFADRVYQELNYVQEARNARRFRLLYADQKDVVVPRAYWEHTASKVLVMDWIEGIKLSDAAQMSEQGLDVIKLVDVGIQCSLRQLLEYGYFHADPHPGNLLATPDGRLAFLDFGMMSETPSRARLAIIGHVVHLVNRDYEAMAKDYYALDFLDPSVDVSPIVPALRGFFDDVLQASVSELNFKTIVDGLGAVLYQYPFNVPAYYALILRSLTVLEGLALYTDPNFKVLAAAYPYMAKRLLTDPNPYLRDSLIELLFKDGTFRWQRLENLLLQGAKDKEYKGGEALQPLIALVLGPDGGPIRALVVSEAIRVMEAFAIGTAADSVKALPGPLQLVPSNLGLKFTEEAKMVELRESVRRCWGLLQSSDGFDPAMLMPLVEVLRQPVVMSMGENIAGGVLQRLAARLLLLALRPAANGRVEGGVRNPSLSL